jgi:hypothetical protein
MTSDDENSSAAAAVSAKVVGDDFADEWKHPLQTLSAYGDAIGRWARHAPANHHEIEQALDGIDLAVMRLRELLAGSLRDHG